MDLTWVIWTGLEVCATEGTGTICLLMWWLCLSFTVLGLASPLQKFKVCKEDCACISKYYLKGSLLIWWEITLRLLLWFVFINSEPGVLVPLPGWRTKEQKRGMQATRRWWAGSKGSMQAGQEEPCKEAMWGVCWGYRQLVTQECKMSKTKIWVCLTQLSLPTSGNTVVLEHGREQGKLEGSTLLLS